MERLKAQLSILAAGKGMKIIPDATIADKTYGKEGEAYWQTASELDNIPGIGPKLRTALLQKFKSVKRIKEAPLADLQNVVGAARGQKIFDALHATQSE